MNNRTNSIKRKSSDQTTKILAKTALSTGLSHVLAPTTLIFGGVAVWAANELIQEMVEDEEVKGISQFFGEVGVECALAGVILEINHEMHVSRGIMHHKDCKSCMQK
ncbi:9021_t:CDS:2 [Ambispora gerdemannii]|uniref:9021_t:CDS:1 n=1 Tax=Ambispora gerdemannii TaxID=144530 RepID=A0A9N9CS48_9GLOM|nr:9021_t:CDS:2 [Ambispora gerdemannii]